MAKFLKYTAWAGLIIFVLLVIAGLLFLSYQEMSQSFGLIALTPATTPIPTVTQTLIPMTPSATPEKAAGPIWVVSRIEEGLLHENGFVYDIVTFTNLDKPSVTLRARCSAPDWPSPATGQQYTINEYQVMIPVEGIYSPLQRFWVLEYHF